MSLDLIATIYGETPQGGTTEAPVALTGVDSVQVCGKNMLPNKAKTNTVAGITYTVNPDKSVTAKGTATSWSNIVIDADFSLPAGTYTLNSNIQTAGVNLVIGKDTTGKKNIAVSSTASKTFALSDSIKHCVAYIAVAPDSVVDTTVYPMLNLGSAALPYEPYQGSVTQLPIPRPLRRVGDVKDKCATRVKSVYDKRIVLNGSEDWKQSGAGVTYLILCTDIALGNHIESSYLMAKEDDALYSRKVGIAANSKNGTIRVYLPNNANPTTFFASNPLTVYYQSTSYNGTNGLDVCLTEYQTGFVELDGTEGVNLGNIDVSADVQQLNIYNVLSSPNNSGNAICSHFKRANVSGGVNSGFQIYKTLLVFGMPRDILLEYGFIAGDSDTYIPAFRAYLAAQKAAGTPVQIAYQLATPEVYATDPVDIFVETIFPIVVFVGPITYKVVAHMHPFKTDWKVQPKTPEGYYNGDWFEIEDYNHILDNYQTIYKIAKALYPDLQIPTFVSPTLGAPTKASEINTIERTIDAFKTLTIALSDVGATKTWLDNGNLFNFEDINRWEQVALSYYTVFLGQVELLPKLQFKLGGAQF